MDNPQDLKKAILARLAEKGDYKTLLENIGDEPDLKKGVLSVLAEKGEYETILKALNDDDKKKQTEEAFSKIAPLFQFSEMITKDAKGSFMQDLKADLDEKTKAGLAELAEEIEDLKEDLREITATLLDTTKSELVKEHLTRYQEAETNLGNKMLALVVEKAAEKAEEMYGNLAQEARLTEDEIEDIIEMSALSVESQIAGIIGEYIQETKITPDQIVGFAEAVKKLIPEARQVSWGDIQNKPDISQGGTSAILVKRMIDDALAGFTGSLPPGGTTGQVLKKLSNANGDADWQDETGGAGVTDGDKGDITVSGGGTVWSIDNQAVTRNKLEHIQSQHFLGRHAAGTGDVQEVSPAQLRTILGLATVATSGDYNDLSNLPNLSVFDEVEQYANLAAFPATGDVSKFYLAQDTGIMYRWTGSGYDVISASLALGETSSTAYRGDRGKIAYDHSQITTGNPHGTTKADIGLGSVPNLDTTTAVSQTHARSHSMTSASDHTATAHRVFYSDASGVVTELALGASGTYLKSNGATSAPSFDTPAGGAGGVSEELAIAYAVSL